jgi:hypothetical protein
MAPAAAPRTDQPTRKRRQAAPTTGYVKFAVTVPREIAEAARKRVESGRAATMSSLVTEALAEKLAQDDIRALLDEMEAEYGPVSEEDREWARQVWDRIPDR